MAKKLNTQPEEALRASRIEQTISTNGWQDIKNIIQAAYNGYMDELLEKESPEARGGIKAITSIMGDIERDLEFGRRARERYTKQQFNTTP